MFLVPSGVIRQYIFKWHSNEWKWSANHLTNDQNSFFTTRDILFHSYMLLLAQNAEKSIKTPFDQSRAIVVYHGSVDCGIVMARKHILASVWPVVKKTLSCSFAFSSRHW